MHETHSLWPFTIHCTNFTHIWKIPTAAELSKHVIKQKGKFCSDSRWQARIFIIEISRKHWLLEITATQRTCFWLHSITNAVPMSLDIFLFNWTTITTYFHPVVVDILPRNLSALFEDCVNGSRNIVQFLSDNLSSPIEFTDLQIILLTVFLGFTALNLALIVFYWNKYGNVITDRFIRPSMCVVYLLAWLWVISADNNSMDSRCGHLF